MQLLPLLAQSTDSNRLAPQSGLIMSVISWLIVGIVAGFLASKIVNKSGDGLIRDLLLGLVGAFVGGLVIDLLHLNIGGGLIVSIIVATAGAILVLVIYHKVIGGGRKTV